MHSINISAFERYARELRAKEMQRYSGLIASRLALWLSLLVHAVLPGLRVLPHWMRSFFSSNPRPAHTK